jgi:broad specificity phosphatase PhoE
MGPDGRQRMSAVKPPVTVWFCRHGEIASHRGDVPLTERGVRDAEAAGVRLATLLRPGAEVEFLHAHTQRTLQTLQAIRRGLLGALDANTDIVLGEPRVEHAIRNPDLYVAGQRVEMVSSLAALAEQLPQGLVSTERLAAHGFFARFLAEPDRIRIWLEEPDPPGERAEDVARRFFTFARSLQDISEGRPRQYICVTHSGPLRALLRRYVLDHDPGEPGYVEAVELGLDPHRGPCWRFRDVIAAAA